jgi:hypothetical protein
MHTGGKGIVEAWWLPCTSLMFSRRYIQFWGLPSQQPPYGNRQHSVLIVRGRLAGQVLSTKSTSRSRCRPGSSRCPHALFCLSFAMPFPNIIALRVFVLNIIIARQPVNASEQATNPPMYSYFIELPHAPIDLLRKSLFTYESNCSLACATTSSERHPSQP